MLLSSFKRFTRIRPNYPPFCICNRQSATWANLQGLVPRQWKRRVAGVIAGATGILVCVFGWSNAYAKDEKKKRVVVLGCGWGAVSFLKNLKPDLYDVVVVSPTNYFIFTPFLASVTVGTIEARTICEPIRKILGKKHKSNAHFYEAECTDVDFENNKIVCIKEDEGMRRQEDTKDFLFRGGPSFIRKK